MQRPSLLPSSFTSVCVYRTETGQGGMGDSTKARSFVEAAHHLRRLGNVMRPRLSTPAVRNHCPEADFPEPPEPYDSPLPRLREQEDGEDGDDEDLQTEREKSDAAASRSLAPSRNAERLRASSRQPEDDESVGSRSDKNLDSNGVPSQATVKPWNLETMPLDQPSALMAPRRRRSKRRMMMIDPKPPGTPSTFQQQPNLFGRAGKMPLRGPRELLEEVRNETGLDDFSVTSVRSMYRLRRRGEEEVERQRARKEVQAMHRRIRPIAKADDDATDNAPAAYVSLERRLAESGRPYIVLNEIVNQRLQLDLFYKLGLLRDMRAALREGKAVVLRAPLQENKEEHECRQAVSSLYISCVEQCRDPAVPPMNYDASCRCYELVLEPKGRLRDTGMLMSYNISTNTQTGVL